MKEKNVTGEKIEDVHDRTYRKFASEYIFVKTISPLQDTVTF